MEFADTKKNKLSNKKHIQGNLEVLAKHSIVEDVVRLSKLYDAWEGGPSLSNLFKIATYKGLRIIPTNIGFIIKYANKDVHFFSPQGLYTFIESGQQVFIKHYERYSGYKTLDVLDDLTAQLIFKKLFYSKEEYKEELYIFIEVLKSSFKQPSIFKNNNVSISKNFVTALNPYEEYYENYAIGVYMNTIKKFHQEGFPSVIL